MRLLEKFQRYSIKKFKQLFIMRLQRAGFLLPVERTEEFLFRYFFKVYDDGSTSFNTDSWFGTIRLVFNTYRKGVSSREA